MKHQGVYGKYTIGKADGSPVDPKATYLVLRLDTDDAARKAALTYAKHTPNTAMAKDIHLCVGKIENELDPSKGIASAIYCIWQHDGDWR